MSLKPVFLTRRLGADKPLNVASMLEDIKALLPAIAADTAKVEAQRKPMDHHIKASPISGCTVSSYRNGSGVWSFR
ncbi:MAG: hypothetical protein FJ194_06985 [Gammaproteobacteria bacterium]|nr:hypothetical protein [Gammaproteobacteria bacterium]